MDGTDLILLGLGVLALPFVVLFLLAGGPILWFGFGVALILAGLLKTVMTDDGSGDGGHQPPLNCPQCGSPNDPDAATCGHCEADL